MTESTDMAGRVTLSEKFGRAAFAVHNPPPHFHCRLGCEKPQPVRLADGRFVCGRCLIQDGVTSEMIECTPETCD